MRAFPACAVCILASALSLGCSKTQAPATHGVMLIVSTNMEAIEFDSVRIEVSQGQEVDGGRWNKLLDEVKAVPGDVRFPTTVLIKAGSNVDQNALIDVTALLRAQPIVLREVEVALPTDRLAELRLLLSESCKGQVHLAGPDGEPQSTCAAANQSCQPDTGMCGPSTVPTSGLPTYTPGDENKGAGGEPTDATVDGNPADEQVNDGASKDAAPDWPQEAPSPDASGPGPLGPGPLEAGPDGPPTCANPCTPVGASRCDGAVVETCTTENSCAQWVMKTICGTHQRCTTGADATASCTCSASPCTLANTTCQDMQTVATCSTDTEGCRYVASTETCVAPASCSGQGDAGTKTCSTTPTDECSQGQAQCVSGKLATCTLGANGHYGYGLPVACGAHQTCTGTVGAAQCTCNADPVCRAVGATCASTSVLASCAQDAQACFYQATSTPCTNGACSGAAGTAVCCTNACAAGGSCTSSTMLQTCAVGGNGCTAVTGTMTCSNGACSGAAGSASCCTNTCTAGPSSCASGTMLQACATGSNGCTAMTTSACSTGACQQRTGPASCIDPNWAEWPAPNNAVDVAAGAAHPQSYTDNGDGTVTDNVTGLMWQKTVSATTMTQAAALAYCPTLTLGGHIDWRVPAIIELASLIDFSAIGAEINATAFPSTPDNFYWSATPEAGESDRAWLVIFTTPAGQLNGDPVTDQSVTLAANVRCVR